QHLRRVGRRAPRMGWIARPTRRGGTTGRRGHLRLDRRGGRVSQRDAARRRRPRQLARRSPHREPCVSREPLERLADIQALFWEAIRHPTGVAEFLANATDETRERFERVFIGDAQLGAIERLEIYANAYYWRLHGVL